jgi:hypothetical protein
MMKKILIGVIALIIASSPAGFSAKAVESPQTSSGFLELAGAQLTWDPESLWYPEGCSRFKFTYVNGTGIELLRLGFDLVSQYGDRVAFNAQVGIKPNVSGTWDTQICDHSLEKDLGPYTLSLSVKLYGGTERSVSTEIWFKTRPADITGLRAVPSTTFVNISWVKVRSAESYEVRIAPASTKRYSSWTTVDNYYNTFKWTGLKRKTTYLVQVRAQTQFEYGKVSTISFKSK